MTKVKISGIRTADDIACANEVQPEFVGLVFCDGRYRLTGNIASKLIFGLRPEIKTVGMFKNQEIGEITALLSAGVADWVELCGDESEDFIRALKLRAEVKVIKRCSLSVDFEKDILKINESFADYISVSARDLVRAPEMHELLKKPFFVTGSFTTESVGELIKSFSPFAVDAVISPENRSSVNRYVFKGLCDEVLKY